MPVLRFVTWRRMGLNPSVRLRKLVHGAHVGCFWRGTASGFQSLVDKMASTVRFLRSALVHVPFGDVRDYRRTSTGPQMNNASFCVREPNVKFRLYLLTIRYAKKSSRVRRARLSDCS